MKTPIKSMKKAFATNLRKVRRIHGWNQLQAATQLGIKRSTYQAYEEGRSCPRAEDLVTLADVFQIGNLRSFIADDGFNFNQQEGSPKVVDGSPLQTNYAKASLRDRNLVDIILGIGSK